MQIQVSRIESKTDPEIPAAVRHHHYGTVFPLQPVALRISLRFDLDIDDYALYSYSLFLFCVLARAPELDIPEDTGVIEVLMDSSIY